MLGGNQARLAIVRGMGDKFNYLAFVEACEAQGIPVLPLAEYCQKVGMYLTGATMFPDLPDVEAYLEIVKMVNGEVAEASLRRMTPEAVQKPVENCCGGIKTK